MKLSNVLVLLGGVAITTVAIVYMSNPNMFYSTAAHDDDTSDEDDESVSSVSTEEEAVTQEASDTSDTVSDEEEGSLTRQILRAGGKHCMPRVVGEKNDYLYDRNNQFRSDMLVQPIGAREAFAASLNKITFAKDPPLRVGLNNVKK